MAFYGPARFRCPSSIWHSDVGQRGTERDVGVSVNVDRRDKEKSHQQHKQETLQSKAGTDAQTSADFAQTLH